MQVHLRSATLAGLGLLAAPTVFAQQSGSTGGTASRDTTTSTTTAPGAPTATGTEGDASTSWLWIAVLAVVVLVVLAVIKFLVGGRRTPPPAV